MYQRSLLVPIIFVTLSQGLRWDPFAFHCLTVLSRFVGVLDRTALLDLLVGDE